MIFQPVPQNHLFLNSMTEFGSFQKDAAKKRLVESFQETMQQAVEPLNSDSNEHLTAEEIFQCMKESISKEMAWRQEELDLLSKTQSNINNLCAMFNEGLL